MTKKYRICVIHSFDPLGGKVGGVETFVRDMLRHKPDDFEFLMIGIDTTGRLPLGVVRRETYHGHDFDFLPVLNYPDGNTLGAAAKLKDSVNLRFMLALARYWPRIRKFVSGQPTSVDLQRVEFAGYAKSLGVPFIQVMHTIGATNLAMDSLLSKYSFVHESGERVAVALSDRFLCVNPFIAERVRQSYPKYAYKVDTQSTWVDTSIFKPAPYPAEGFKIAYAGRLDMQKQPPQMFRVISRLKKIIGPALEFHYMGSADPEKFPEFADIRDITTKHGFCTSNQVALILAQCHAGILTSGFEGMPFSVLETLGAGRPVCAFHLPQLTAVIKEGISGRIVERNDDVDVMIDQLADAFAATHEDIKAGRITPDLVAGTISEFTPEVQISAIYNRHRELQNKRFALSDVYAET